MATVLENYYNLRSEVDQRIAQGGAPSAPESYSREIGRVIQTLLPAWLQFRNTFVPIKKKEKEAPAS